MDLTNFTIGASCLNANKIYLGKVSKNGTSWVSKKDITSEFISTMVDYLGGGESKSIRDIRDSSGKILYTITCKKV